MIKEVSVNFGNFILSLSDALDLASSKIASHQIRTAFIAWQMAKTAKLPEKRIENIYLASLFHDIGALSLEEKIKLHAYEVEELEVHCLIGESLFNTSSLFAPAKGLVRHHHRTRQSWGTQINSELAVDAQIICLADYLERHIRRKEYILHQKDRLDEKIKTADFIDKEIAELYFSLSGCEDFWFDLSSPRLYSILLHMGPFRNVEIGYDALFSIAELFRYMIDFKSPFTATHSTGVAECAVLLSQLFGLTEHEVQLIKIAGYFHDLGKLAVPNSILEKPGKLTKDEFGIIKQHTYFTYSVLNTIGGLDLIAEWAAFHHEKLDGSGYPFHIDGELLSSNARIMTVADIFTALAEDRPYRAGMNSEKIKKIISGMVDTKAIDPKIAAILFENFQDIKQKVKEKQMISQDLFEREFQ